MGRTKAIPHHRQETANEHALLLGRIYTTTSVEEMLMEEVALVEQQTTQISADRERLLLELEERRQRRRRRQKRQEEEGGSDADCDNQEEEEDEEDDEVVKIQQGKQTQQQNENDEQQKEENHVPITNNRGTLKKRKRAVVDDDDDDDNDDGSESHGFDYAKRRKQEQEIQDHFRKHSADDLSDSDSETSNGKLPRTRLRRRRQQQQKLQSQQEDEATISSPPSKQQSFQKKKGKKKKSEKKKSVTVQFSNTLEYIGPPEIQIVKDDSGMTTIQWNAGDEDSQQGHCDHDNENDDDNHLIVATWSFPDDVQLVPPIKNVCSISTLTGAMDLIQLCNSNNNNNNNQRQQESLEKIQTALRDKTLQVQMDTLHRTLVLKLTRYALHVCSPTEFPVTRTQRKNLALSKTKYHTTFHLHQALAAILVSSTSTGSTTGTILDDMITQNYMIPSKNETSKRKQKNKQGDNHDKNNDDDENQQLETTTTTTWTASMPPKIVTAKQVYALTDNLQLKQALSSTSSSSSSNNNPNTTPLMTTIPGLVPTLRPYQEKAVEWMLQREQKQQQQQQQYSMKEDDNNEWQLAWMVICNNNKNNNIMSSSSSSSSSCIEFLPDYCQQHMDICESPDKKLLLLNPFTGWLAESLMEAKSLTSVVQNNDNDNNNPRGGILAESMGLGKTVELLACILAHPCSDPTTVTAIEPKLLQNSKNDETIPNARRRLEFSSSSSDMPTTKENTGNDAERNDTSGNGEQDSDNNVVDEDEKMEADITESGSETISDETRKTESVVEVTTGNTNDSSFNINRPNLITPCKEHEEEEEKENNGPSDNETGEIWIDEDVIGSCICGDLICFSTPNKGLESVVICKDCDEPMHMCCALFETKQQLQRVGSRLLYRQTYTNNTVECYLCDSKRCPCCVAASATKPLRSSATLIITPPAILNQWQREIARHTRTKEGKPLRVTVYEGVERLTKDNAGKKKVATARSIQFLHPHQLADSDVVLMTFDALMSDLGHSDDNRFVPSISSSGFTGLRNRKKYRVIPSPLSSIHWWRVCLDEAQRVETPTARSAQMALKLEAEYRWCVSGTPVGRGKLEDLYGLLLFLRLDPFCDKLSFRRCFDPAVRGIEKRIKHLLSNVFWRSTKSLDIVRDQMGVPEQIEKKIYLQFSSIEKHFYNRQLEETLSAAGDVVEREKNKKKRKASQLNLLAEHLHRLRAACCHPQVGSSGIGFAKNRRGASSDSGVNSRVMTMSQILDQFIDDAKLKCEEALRLFILHTNGMAAASRLMVEAKQRGQPIQETDRSLLERSCKLYLESLQLANENAVPTLLMGETTVAGSTGFLFQQKVVKSCAFTMAWKWIGNKNPDVWSKFDFTLGPARKISALKICAITSVPKDISDDVSEQFKWRIIHPKDCVLQNATIGGEFIDVHAFTLPQPNGANNTWFQEDGFIANKSKNWRLVVKSFHTQKLGKEADRKEKSAEGCFSGFQVEFYEATIGNDTLQRLHCLHNVASTFSSLLQVYENEENSNDNIFSRLEVENQIQSNTTEARKIEALYVRAGRLIHNDHHRRLEEASKVREKHEVELRNLTRLVGGRAEVSDCWDDKWWDDFLVICRLHGSDTEQNYICNKILDDLDSQGESSDRTGIVAFPPFGDITGLRTALEMRMRDIRIGLGRKRSGRKTQQHPRQNSDGFQPREGRFKCEPGAHRKCMQAILALSSNPSDAEVFENSHCKVCKADWFQTGDKCRHCVIGEELEDLTPDRITMKVLQSIHSVLKGPTGSLILKNAKETARVDYRAKKFFEVMESTLAEKNMASRMWKAHLDLLNDIDELSQSKSTMRLSYDGEDLTQLMGDQINAVVQPIDISTTYHENAAKQAMALGALSRSKGTLQYLRNQRDERASTDNNKNDHEEENCMVCLSAFDGNRAVLQCGHSFHLSPCLDKIRSRSSTLISCPLRCKVRTDAKDVMIASDKARDDGSRNKRNVEGSFGTKVTRLICDVLDVSEMGDKSIVFSQWDDMLDICEHALASNGVNYVRATSLRKIGESTKRFRAPECSVLLLNVKNGAEGLTLLEATHVFMIEPLLNCGIDSQAINRVHRIGQNRKTYVWRYLVKDTIEIKIDKMREDHQEDELEDSINMSKKSAISAGGIDGGFQSEQELLDLLQPV